MLKKDDIILIKSYGNEKTKIFLRGVNEVLMIDASFEEVKFAINNDRNSSPGLRWQQQLLRNWIICLFYAGFHDGP